MGVIRVWHKPENPAPEPRKPVIWKPPAPEPHPVWVQAQRDAQRLDQRLAQLHKRDIKLSRDWPAVPEPEDKRLLNDPVKSRSYRKQGSDSRVASNWTGRASGLRFHPSALGE